MRFRSERVWAPEGTEGGSPAEGATGGTAAAPAATAAEGQPASGQPATTDGLLSAPPAEGSPPPAAEEAKPPEGEKPPEEKKDEAPAELKPEDYKLDLPESIHPEDDLLKDFLAGAAKGGLDNDSVNAILKSLGPKMAERQQAPQKAWQELNKDWQGQVRADPEYGGEKLAPTVQRIAATIDRFSKPEEAAAVRQALDMTGAGNNPAIVKFLARVSAALSEAGPVAGQPAPMAALQRMYPSATG